MRRRISWERYPVVVWHGRNLEPHCAICGKRILQGQPIRWGPRRQLCIHEKCTPEVDGGQSK